MGSIKLKATTVGAKKTTTALTGVKVQTAPVHVGNAKYSDTIPEGAVDVTVGVFFDGTQNNRKNTEARIEHEKGAAGNQDIAQGYIFDEGSSFENDHSNISRSEPYYFRKEEKNHVQLSVYIEGAGTEDYQKDDWFFGVAQGIESTGIRKKVEKGCKEIAKRINRKVETTPAMQINRLTIDTFGFSRGAAAARNFVHEIHQRQDAIKEVIIQPANGFYTPNSSIVQYKEDYGTLGEALASYGWSIRTLRVRFVGLYDTVASYGVDHNTDTRQLNLDAIKRASHVFQIAADDEHRAKFRRTDIQSAGSRGKEVFFPGVHSDIGGGYKDGEGEKLTVHEAFWTSSLREEKQRLIDEGWYREGELSLDRFLGYLNAERTSISNRYSYIPLHIMSVYAMARNVGFQIDYIKDDFEIKDEELIKAKNELESYVWGHRDKLLFENPDDRQLLKKLRHDYFHFSAHHQYTWGVRPNKPNFENGVRKRIVNRG